jgi:5'-3' exonuclease
VAQPVYLIDASIYIFRAYFSYPDEWHSPDGYSVNALCGYTQFLLKFLKQTRPNYIAAAYDESLGSCFRNDIYSGYKSSRALPDTGLAFQLNACKGLTELMGIMSPASHRYEADDIIATLARQSQQNGKSVAIVTRDKDLGQLLKNKDDFLWGYAADKRIYTANANEYFGVNSEQILDYLSLVGDSVDDIPGVPGIGKKTAINLLQKFGSIMKMFEDLSAVADSPIRGAKAMAQKLDDYRDQIAVAQALVKLELNVPLVHSERLAWQPPALEVIRYYLDQFGLGGRFQNQLENCYWWQV